MPEPQSPFDDSPTVEEPPARGRRPWWRWNLVTLFAALFVLVWVRFAFGLGPGTIWSLVLLLVAAWVIGPMTVVPVRFPWPSLRTSTSPHSRRFSNRVLQFFSWLSLAAAAVAMLHLCWVVVLLLSPETYHQLANIGLNRRYLWMQLGAMITPPFFEIVGAGLLYSVCEVAFRLEKLTVTREHPSD